MNRLFAFMIRRLRPHEASTQPAFCLGENLVGFVWRTTGPHQFYAAILAVGVALLNFVPIDLQKRIVDGPIMQGEVEALIFLAVVYLAAVLMQAALKYALLVYQGWISESAIKISRDQLAAIASEHSKDSVQNGQSAAVGGQTANVIGSEIDRVCSFIGTSISDFVVNVAMLVIISGYMLYIQPVIAVCSLIFLLPQVLLATYLQQPLNTLFERQIGLVRKLGDEVIGQAAKDPATSANEFRTITALYRNRIRFYFLKFGLKTLLNLANAMGPLVVIAVGGYMVIQGTTTIGTVVAFVSGFERLSGPLRDLLNFYRESQQASVQHQLIVQWVGEEEGTSKAASPAKRRKPSSRPDRS